MTPTEIVTSCRDGVSGGTACRLCLAPDPSTVKIAVSLASTPNGAIPPRLVGRHAHTSVLHSERNEARGGRNCPVPRAARRGRGAAPRLCSPTNCARAGI